MRKRNFDKNIENVRNIARAFQNDIFLAQQEALNNSLQLKTKRLLNKKRSITEIMLFNELLIKLLKFININYLKQLK